jgi:BirA family biotin operon repressor/biotin-[acetyl-CoA-carboxylase] ligase
MPEQLASLIGRPVAALPSLSSERNRVMATLLNGLAEAMQMFAAHGFSAFRERWNVLHAYVGQQVVILDGDQVMQQGQAMGVDDSGRLLLQTVSGEVVTVLAGDVSLRMREN